MRGVYVEVWAGMHCANINQRAKKVSDSLQGPVDFAIGLVSLVLNLPEGQVMKKEL